MIPYVEVWNYERSLRSQIERLNAILHSKILRKLEFKVCLGTAFSDLKSWKTVGSKKGPSYQ